MTDAADAERLTAALVSRRSGILTQLAPQPRGPDEPCPPHLWNATMAHYGFAAASPAMRTTGGKGLTEDQAKLAAIGEALERYAAVAWDTGRMRVGPARADAITPPECVLYSDAQHAEGCPYTPWTGAHDTSWVAATELPAHTDTEIPAALVYLISPPPRRQDYFTAVTSNGLATGRNLTHAVLSGLHEVIERDAFMITWLNRLPATQISPPSTGCRAAAVIRQYARFGVEIRLMKLHSDQAPYVIMAVAEDPSDTGVFRMVGLGCDLDPAVAVDKAVFEVCQLRPGMARRATGAAQMERLARYEDVTTIEDHALFHTIPAHASEFDFLAEEAAHCTLDDLPNRAVQTEEEALDLITSTARKTGVRTAYVDITPADIAPLGPRVVRVVGTGLQPIHFGFGQGRYGHARLLDAPVAWGLRTAPLGEAALNPCPHPLA